MTKQTFILFCGLFFFANLNAQTWQIGSPNASSVTATLQDGTLTISGTGAMTDWIWTPGSVNTPWWNVRSSIHTVIIGNGVTTIGDDTFSDCTGLTSVTIPNSVTSIGGGAFFDCTGLTSVIIPNSVQTIGQHAFSRCAGLTSVSIGDGVTSIGRFAFRNCISLTSVSIGNNVQVIEADVFDGCTALTSITIPNSVATIRVGAFRGCTNLKNLIIEDGTSTLTLDINGVGWSPEILYLGRNINWRSEAQFGTNIKQLTIGNNVTTTIGGNVLFGAGLTSIEVGANNPNYSSRDGVLFDKNQTALIRYPAGKQGAYTIPNSVTTIGGSAFSNCTGLTSVIIPNGVTTIGSRAFSNCTGLTSVIIPESVTTIGDSAFGDCTALTSIVVEANNSNYSSRDGVLFNKNQTILIMYPRGKQGAYTIPNSVETFGRAFVNHTGLTSVIIGNGVTAIENIAFVNCTALTSVNIPNSVTTIGDWAFQYCTALTSVVIPNSVTDIGEYTFFGCTALASLTIGNGITEIGRSVFGGCAALASIISLNPVPPAIFSMYTFYGVDVEVCRLYVLPEALADYQTADFWKDFLHIEVYEPSSIETVNTNETIQIFPNPVVHELTITNYDWQADDVVELYDMSGRIVETWRAASLQHGEFTIDMSPFKSGNYILRIGNRVAKVVKL